MGLVETHHKLGSLNYVQRMCIDGFWDGSMMCIYMYENLEYRTNGRSMELTQESSHSGIFHKLHIRTLIRNSSEYKIEIIFFSLRSIRIKLM